jgi:hypothetical protein
MLVEGWGVVDEVKGEGEEGRRKGRKKESG